MLNYAYNMSLKHLNAKQQSIVSLSPPSLVQMLDQGRYTFVHLGTPTQNSQVQRKDRERTKCNVNGC